MEKDHGEGHCPRKGSRGKKDGSCKKEVTLVTRGHKKNGGRERRSTGKKNGMTGEGGVFSSKWLKRKKAVAREEGTKLGKSEFVP